jgi:hypothetical protein
MNRHKVILACLGLAVALIIILLAGMDCFFFSLGFLLIPIGFGTMLAGRFWRILAKNNQNQSGMNWAFLTILAGAVMFMAGIAIIYLVVTFMRPE